ncbi:hypothetical protein ESCO_005723 [Escovopsis weberi]|uniref:Uncharacterized protein n=1 Tax=Escovopsis weberi TaxID=150374 RepID=A0A0M8MWH8_ESCWE|nr:hypothetical protein ESCO_005723 [Escovopsis weberi]
MTASWTNTTSQAEETQTSTPVALTTTTTTHLVTLTVSTFTETPSVIVITTSASADASSTSLNLPWSTTSTSTSGGSTWLITLTGSSPVETGTITTRPLSSGHWNTSRSTSTCTHPSWTYRYPNISATATSCSQVVSGTATFERCLTKYKTHAHTHSHSHTRKPAMTTAPHTKHPLTTCNTTSTRHHSGHWNTTHTYSWNSSSDATTFMTSTVKGAASNSRRPYPIPTVEISEAQLPDNPNYPWGADSPLHRHQNVTNLSNGLIGKTNAKKWIPALGRVVRKMAAAFRGEDDDDDDEGIA